MPRNPKSGNTTPKRAREDGKRMEEMIIDNLVDKTEYNVCQETNNNFGHIGLG
jgi:hypothetical protein